jgi:hypothetical protein
MESGKALPKQAVEETEGNRQNLSNARHKVSPGQSSACPSPPSYPHAGLCLSVMAPGQGAMTRTGLDSGKFRTQA